MSNVDEPDVRLPRTLEDEKRDHAQAGGSATPSPAEGDVGSAQNQGPQGGGLVEGDGTGQANTTPKDR
jgi:hypothetical protein